MPVNQERTLPDDHWSRDSEPSPELASMIEYLASHSTKLDLACALIALAIPGYSFESARAEYEHLNESEPLNLVQKVFDSVSSFRQDASERLSAALAYQLSSELYALLTIVADTVLDDTQLDSQEFLSSASDQLGAILHTMRSIPESSIHLQPSLIKLISHSETSYGIVNDYLESRSQSETTAQKLYTLLASSEFSLPNPSRNAEDQLLIPIYDLDPSIVIQANLDTGELLIAYSDRRGERAVTKSVVCYRHQLIAKDANALLDITVTHLGVRIIGGGTETMVRSAPELLKDFLPKLHKSLARNRQSLNLQFRRRDGSYQLVSRAPAWVYALSGGKRTGSSASP